MRGNLSCYNPGPHVGRAFQPDAPGASGWKARPTNGGPAMRAPRMPLSDEEARHVLKDAFRAVEEDYRARGIFQDRFGFGRSPALVGVDFAFGWTDEAYAGGSRRLDGPVEATQRLLDAARAGALPVIYTTSPWRPDSGDQPFKSAADRSPAFRAWDQRACR